jgi:hypothetical protein
MVEEIVRSEEEVPPGGESRWSLAGGTGDIRETVTSGSF